jgi:hypothetical protein
VAVELVVEEAGEAQSKCQVVVEQSKCLVAEEVVVEEVAVARSRCLAVVVGVVAA